jgi:hypothetical protein
MSASTARALVALVALATPISSSRGMITRTVIASGTHQPRDKPVHPDMVPSEQHLHGEPVALGDPSDQDFVRSGLHRQSNRPVNGSRAVGARFKQDQRKFAAT